MDSHFVLGISEGDNITKKLTKTNKIVIGAIIVVVAIVSIILGVKAYSDYQDKQAINSSLSHISSVDKSFTAEANQAKKLAALKSMENEYSNYKKSQKVFSEVSSKYTDEITKMKKVFIDGYDATISKNTLSNIDKITDESSLNTAKANLQTELKLITDEKNTVCEAKSLTNYNTKISTLIKSYDARIKSIEDEEAKAAAEAKAKKGTEVAAEKSEGKSNQKANQNSSGNSTRSFSDRSSTNFSNDNTDQSPHVFKKGPKPAKYSVIKAHDFPNDFPNDGWSWHYSTYVWTPKSSSWIGDRLEAIQWIVTLRSSTSNVDISLAPQTIANVKKFMPPAPTLEESKKMVKQGDDYFYIRYCNGIVNL